MVERRRDALERRWRRWEPVTLDQRFDTVAAAYPDRPCVIDDARAYSYEEMAGWSRALARGLVSLGVQPGDRVALLMDNRPELMAVKLAVSRVGAIAVPLNHQYRQGELLAALGHVEASVLVTVARSVATDFLAALDGLAPGWEAGASVAALPSLHHVVLVDPERPGAIDLSELARRGAQIPESVLATLAAQADPQGVSDIFFTSGTSGLPVAAELTHDMILRSGYGSAYHRGFDDGRRLAFALPMYHVFGYVEGLMASLFVGGAIMPRRVFNPASMLEAVAREHAQEILLVPTMTVGLVEQAARGGYDLSSLESVTSAASPAPTWLWERVVKDMGPKTVFTGYGQTEVSGGTTMTAPGDPLEVVAETVGAPKFGGIAADGVAADGRLAQYRTVDPETGAPMPAGAPGELSVSGPIVTRAYHRDPERTARSITDGWLRTGDMGWIDSSGYLHLTGRARELFKVGGELVAPKEVEDLLTRLPGVGQAYVAGIPDERLGEVGWAWVVPDGTAELDERELIRYTRQHLAAFKVPRKVVFLDAKDLPLSGTGKVQKFQLVATADHAATSRQAN